MHSCMWSAVSVDNSAVSSSSSKSRSKFKYSDSYGSSSSKAASSQAGTIAFSMDEIYKATNNFSPVNKIGDGSFGTVYKGKLKDGSFVAIKRAKKVDIVSYNAIFERKNLCFFCN
ncbi:hypothetical protein CsSME_00041085 [Camellia sinensis var. sinensis]